MILEYLVSAFGKSAIDEAARTIAFSQKRRVTRRAIRDAIEDEIMNFSRDIGYPEEATKEYIKDKRRYLKREIRARFDGMLR